MRRRVYASVSTQAYIGTIRRRRGLRRWRRAYHVKWEGRGSLRSEPGRARFVLALATKRPQHPDTFSQHMAFQRPILMIKVWSSSLTDPWRVHGVLLETFFVPRHHRPHDGTIFKLVLKFGAHNAITPGRVYSGRCRAPRLISSTDPSTPGRASRSPPTRCPRILIQVWCAGTAPQSLP